MLCIQTENFTEWVVAVIGSPVITKPSNIRSFRSMYLGTESNDIIEGSNGNDMIVGKGGDDKIYARAGADRVFSGGGTTM